jgi:hypothetical protein
MGQDITLSAETPSNRSNRREVISKFSSPEQVSTSMDRRRDTPDWVICTACRTIYAPSLFWAVECPKCGDPRWEPSAIPDGEEPLESPLAAWTAA